MSLKYVAVVSSAGLISPTVPYIAICLHMAHVKKADSTYSNFLVLSATKQKMGSDTGTPCKSLTGKLTSLFELL
jgi:hypothetical protein